MKTPEEIKKALECCSKPQQADPCNGCPYDECGCGNAGTENFPHDALAYIHLLEERIELMKEQMHGDCGVCKHNGDVERCVNCLFDKDHSHPLWEYEGFPTDMEKED